jgi:methyl-accepting chemotaxis protein
MVSIAAVSCGTVAFFAAKSSFSTTQSLIANHLGYIASTKRDILAAKLDALRSEVTTLANNPGFTQLFDGLYLGFGSLSEETVKMLSEARMNPNKDVRSAIQGADYYLENFKQAESWLKDLADKAAFTAITLVDKKKRLIYSTTHQRLGAMGESEVLRSAVDLSLPQKNAVMTSFSAPAAGEDGAAYIAVAVPSPAGRSSEQRAGTLIVGIGTKTLDRVLHDDNGFGPHGEAVVAGRDGVLRSTSRFGGTGTQSITLSNKESASPGTETTVYRGQHVLAASETLQVGDDVLNVIAIEPKSEMLAPATDLLWKIMMLTGFIIVATFILSLLASRSISKPIVQLVKEMKRLATGDTSGSVGGTSRGDEVGDMSRAVLVFKQNALAKEAAEQATRELEIAADAERGALEAERGSVEAERRQRLSMQAAVFEEIGKSLSALAKGVLTRKIEMSFPEEYARLREDFNAAVEQLEVTISAVAGQAGSMASIASEMNSGTRELAKRTEQQAAVLENAVRALNSVSSDITRTADAADEADRTVSAVHLEAASSDTIVSQAIEGMNEIEESSRQIASIVNVIDEIAFQTNLLALNASVEAARAGEGGRGFAVVASEVRELAQRSADAAKEIKDLIGISSQRVQRGTQLVSTTSTQLKNIAHQISHIKTVVSNIAATASNQAKHLSTIGATIGEIDDATQQTAAMTEESTAACHSLDTEAARLLALVRTFSFNQDLAAPLSRPRAQASAHASIAV